jgi:hypothetical protein
MSFRVLASHMKPYFIRYRIFVHDGCGNRDEDELLHVLTVKCTSVAQVVLKDL